VRGVHVQLVDDPVASAGVDRERLGQGEDPDWLAAVVPRDQRDEAISLALQVRERARAVEAGELVFAARGELGEEALDEPQDVRQVRRGAADDPQDLASLRSRRSIATRTGTGESTRARSAGEI
jgi:hypothetical protein